MRVRVEKSFNRELKKLPPDRQEAVLKALLKFQTTPNLPSLAFRPLTGAHGYFIINPHRGDRIILRKLGEDSYAAVDVGPHDNVYRRWNR